MNDTVSAAIDGTLRDFPTDTLTVEVYGYPGDGYTGLMWAHNESQDFDDTADQGDYFIALSAPWSEVEAELYRRGYAPGEWSVIGSDPETGAPITVMTATNRHS